MFLTQTPHKNLFCVSLLYKLVILRMKNQYSSYYITMFHKCLNLIQSFHPITSKVQEAFGLTKIDFLKIVLNAVDYIFADEATKTVLRKRIQSKM